MIVNVRGTSGSGKTTLVRSFIDVCTNVKPIRKHHRKSKKGTSLVGYKMTHKSLGKIYVIGPYESSSGGCDPIGDTPYTRKLIKKFSKKGHVLFEGWRMNNGYSKNLELFKKLKQRFAFAFLDTPYATCIRRANKRRKARGTPGKFHEGPALQMYYSNLHVLQKCVRDHANPVILDHKNALAELIDIFRKGR